MESDEVKSYSASWDRATREYEERSLLYNFIVSTEEDDQKDNAIEHDKDSVEPVCEPEKAKETELEKTLPIENIAAKNANGQNEAATSKQTQNIENNERDWEIREIQKEIEQQQKVWDPVYSDDEGTGAEDAAVHKDLGRRAKVMNEVVKEVLPAPANKKDENHVPGEGWKRLQLRAETRVKNFPEQYVTYPQHKFPLRD